MEWNGRKEWKEWKEGGREIWKVMWKVIGKTCQYEKNERMKGRNERRHGKKER
jgi:hypothetical protein